MYAEVAEAFSEAEKNDTVKVAVITGLYSSLLLLRDPSLCMAMVGGGERTGFKSGGGHRNFF